MNKIPILFDTTAASTSTSQNHDESKGSTTPLIRKKREQKSICDARYSDDALYFGRNTGYELTDDYLYVYNFRYLDTEIIKQKIKEKSNITELHLTHVRNIDSQKAQEIATILKNSNINILWLELLNITDSQELIAVLKYTNINVLQLGHRDSISVESSQISPQQLKFESEIYAKYISEVVKGLKDTNVEELVLSNNHMGDKAVIDIIKLGYLKKLVLMLKN